jgi:hypothetical protein
MTATFPFLLRCAGAGQLILAIACHFIPEMLQLEADVAQLRPLTRQIFWVDSYYVWATFLVFGVVCVLKPHWLLDRSPLATLLLGGFATWWGARLLIQFFYYSRTGYVLHESLLVLLFSFLTLVYAAIPVLLLTAGATRTAAETQPISPNRPIW